MLPDPSSLVKGLVPQISFYPCLLGGRLKYDTYIRFLLQSVDVTFHTAALAVLDMASSQLECS